MMVEIEWVNGQLFFESGLAPPLENGALPALLDFDVSEQREGSDHIEVFHRGLLQGGVEVMEHIVEAGVTSRDGRRSVFAMQA